MKQFFYLAIMLVFSNYLSAQTEEQLIQVALDNYMEGTSYNQIDRIEKAFYKDADLFLDNKEKQLWVVPSAEYISWFKKAEYGKFNGRVAKLLSIEYFDNIAMAKVEILIPKAEKQFIDMFILKKIEGEWKIISKTAASQKSNKTGQRILFVVSNATYYGDSKLSTGNSFKEIVRAYEILDKGGYTIDFVSPEGGAVPLAYINTSDEQEKNYLYRSDFMYSLAHTNSPGQVNPADYRAIYFVGGGSAMFGVPENEAIQQIAMKIYEENKGVIASVCHGTAGIVHLKTKDGKYLVEGKNINGYPDSYERKDSEYYQHFPFQITQTIEQRGGNFKFAPKGIPHLEADKRVITGQNHLSANLVAEKIIETLENHNK